MNEKNNSTITIEGSFIFTLFIVFMVLKLCNVINWAWVWVFSPLWIPLLIVIIGLTVVAIGNAVFRAKYKKILKENEKRKSIDDWF